VLVGEIPNICHARTNMINTFLPKTLTWMTHDHCITQSKFKGNIIPEAATQANAVLDSHKH
jgi:hypothetical protein